MILLGKSDEFPSARIYKSKRWQAHSYYSFLTIFLKIWNFVHLFFSCFLFISSKKNWTSLYRVNANFFINYIFIYDPLRDLVPFVQFQEREKHLWRSVTFSKVEPATSLKVQLFHGCFSRFWNCTNGTKLSKASYIFIYIYNETVKVIYFIEFFNRDTYSSISIFTIFYRYFTLQHSWVIFLTSSTRYGVLRMPSLFLYTRKVTLTSF